MGAMDDLALGVPLTVQAAQQLLETETLSRQQRRNLTRFVGEVEQRAQGLLNDRIRASNADLTERYEAIDDQVITLKEQTRKINGQLRRGRITPAEARKALARIGTATREVRERTEQLAHDAQAVRDLASTNPADYEADLVAKYPALGRRLPVLRPSDLNRP